MTSKKIKTAKTMTKEMKMEKGIRRDGSKFMRATHDMKMGIGEMILDNIIKNHYLTDKIREMEETEDVKFNDEPRIELRSTVEDQIDLENAFYAMHNIQLRNE